MSDAAGRPNGRESAAGSHEAGEPAVPRRELPPQLRSRLRDLHQVELLLELEQTRYREHLAAWVVADGDAAPPSVPDSYREIVARLQIALGHVSTVCDLLRSRGSPT